MKNPQKEIEKCTLFTTKHESTYKLDDIPEVLEEIKQNNDLNDIIHYIYCIGFTYGYLSGHFDLMK